MNKHERGLSRRAFVGKLTVGAAGGAVAISVGAKGASALAGAADLKPAGNRAETPPTAAESQALAAPAPSAITYTAPAPWQLVQPLRAGSPLNDGWRLVDLSGVLDGACVVTIANRSGREQRVHLCRNDGNPQGLVYTDRFDLVVMNGGRGDLPTEEDFGQAVAAVAHAIAANEQRSADIGGLHSQSEREERFAAAARLR